MTVLKASPFDRDVQFAAKRRAVILEAAAAFRRRGFHNSSMTEIAAALGLTKAALYYYVRNKAEVLRECHVMAYDAMDSVLRDTKGQGETGLAQLAVTYEGFAQMLTRDGLALLTDVDSLSGDDKQFVLKRRSRIEKTVTAMVKRGQRDGSIRAGNSRLMVYYFMGALNWLNVWYDNSGRVSGDDVAAHFVEQMTAGLRA